jgi:hypothetical protein
MRKNRIYCGSRSAYREKQYAICDTRMVFSRTLDKPIVLERERREEANFANFSRYMRVICTFGQFALRNFLS